MLPLIHSRISSGDPVWPSRMQPTPDMICPGVQYPHWNASWSMNACCSGCNGPSSESARPSMVVTCAPSRRTASVRHPLTRRPSTRTVHAPHAPASQPFFVPVNPKCSRSRSSSEVRLSTVTVRRVPLTVNETWLLDALSAAAAVPGSDGPATTAAPLTAEAARNVRRRRLAGASGSVRSRGSGDMGAIRPGFSGARESPVKGVPAVPCQGDESGGEQGLDRAALVHGPVALGDLVQGQVEIEDQARVDVAGQDPVDQVGQVAAH